MLMCQRSVLFDRSVFKAKQFQLFVHNSSSLIYFSLRFWHTLQRPLKDKITTYDIESYMGMKLYGVFVIGLGNFKCPIKLGCV